jgi:hypothetical protein
MIPAKLQHLLDVLVHSNIGIMYGGSHVLSNSVFNSQTAEITPKPRNGELQLRELYPHERTSSDLEAQAYHFDDIPEKLRKYRLRSRARLIDREVATGSVHGQYVVVYKCDKRKAEAVSTQSQSRLKTESQKEKARIKQRNRRRKARMKSVEAQRVEPDHRVEETEQPVESKSKLPDTRSHEVPVQLDYNLDDELGQINRSSDEEPASLSKGLDCVSKGHHATAAQYRGLLGQDRHISQVTSPEIKDTDRDQDV